MGSVHTMENVVTCAVETSTMDLEELLEVEEKLIAKRPIVKPRISKKRFELMKNGLNIICKEIASSVQEFITIPDISRASCIHSYATRACLSYLCETGLLTESFLTPDSGYGLKCLVDRELYAWKDNTWMIERFVNTGRIIGLKFGRIERETKRLWVKGNWDGRIYFINRSGKAFLDLCATRGIEVDPDARWTCGCKAKRDWVEGRCSGCDLESPRYLFTRKPDVAQKAISNTFKCNRCGTEVKIRRRNGKKLIRHPKMLCNIEIAKQIMIE